MVRLTLENLAEMSNNSREITSDVAQSDHGKMLEAFLYTTVILWYSISSLDHVGSSVA